MKCSNCSKDIDEDVFPPPLTYCPYCGLKLKDSGADEAETMHFCPHCGKELPGKVSFCPYCGGEIGRRATTPYAVKESAEPLRHGAKPAEPQPEIDRKTQKLYKQWMKYADLPPEAIPKPEPAPRAAPPGAVKKLPRIPVMYIVIGLCLIALFVLIIVALVQC